MARATSSSAVKFAWPLVILGSGFVICLILAIVFNSQKNTLIQQNQDLEEQLDRYVSEEQRSGPAVQELVSESQSENQTVIRTVLDRIESLKGLIGVSGDTSISQIRSRLQERGVEGSLLARIRTLTGQVSSLQSEVGSLESDVQDARQKIDSLQQQKQQWANQLQQARQDMQEQLQAQSQQAANVEQQLSSMEQNLTQQVSQTRQELQSRISELENTREQLNEKNDQLQQRIDTLLAKPGIEAQGRSVAVPDGRITAVLSDQKKAYISLGQGDHLRLGMTFEVFGSEELVTLDSEQLADDEEAEPEETVVSGIGGGATVIRTGGGDQGQTLGEIRGKATVEVIGIEENRALVRVLRKKSDARLTAGDVLVNVAYDPEREVVFYVHGRFDMNGDGKYESSDRQQLESVIRQWGGRVAEELSYEVDFVVLGDQPELPEQTQDGGMASPQQVQRRQAARQAFEEYQQIAGQANQLAIPTLNQNRLLALVGYYRTNNN